MVFSVAGPDTPSARPGAMVKMVLQLWTAKAGEVMLTVPKLRTLPFETAIIERYRTLRMEMPAQCCSKESNIRNYLSHGRRLFATTIHALTLSLMVLQILAVLNAFAQPAYAYVDPGSGLLAFQIISSTLAGIIFLLRKRLHEFCRLITGHSKSKSEEVTKQ